MQKPSIRKGWRSPEQMGYRESISFLGANLGGLARWRGDYIRAQAYLQEGLVVARALGHRWYIGCILRELGELHLDQEPWMPPQRPFTRPRKSHSR